MSQAVITAPQSGKLIRLEEARKLIAEARTVEEVVEIRDRAQLLLHAIRDKTLNEEMAVDLAELKVRAERRVGQLLSESPKHRGGRPSKTSDVVSEVSTLPSLGITHQESSRCQAIANLPEKVFEQKIAEGRKVKEITTSAILKVAKTHKRKSKRKASLAGDAGALLPPSARIVTADAVAELANLPAGGVRLAFADPPYNVGVDYGHGADKDRLPDDEYVRWCRSWIRAVHRALAGDGTFWLLCGYEYADLLAVELREAGFHRRAWVTWYETFGVCNSAKTNFSRTSRPLFYCVKDARKFAWDVEAVTRPSDRQTKYDDPRADPEGKVWDDVWQIPRLTGTSAERLPDFPTQLPLALLLPIVGATSDPGDLVLDPFCGSGTTGVAALRLGRRFVGIEKNEEFARVASERLKGVSNGPDQPRA